MEKRTIAISGASGLVGRALAQRVEASGYRVLRLVRRGEDASDAVLWKPGTGEVEADRLEGTFALVHLAGANLAAGRWSDARRRAIRDSRVDATRRLVESLGALERPPQTLLCASAVGYYGDTSERHGAASEEDPPGDGFLAAVCVEWERAAAEATRFARVVHLRFGVVLSPRGGALARMLPVFRAGLGGRLGNGSQIMPWITLHDAVEAIVWTLEHESACGAFNLAAPERTNNLEFTRALGKALSRPTVLVVPRFVLTLALGDLARETLLASTHVAPRKLESGGFTFRDASIEPALRATLAAG